MNAAFAIIICITLSLLAGIGFAWFFYWLERYRWQGVYFLGCVFGWGVVAGIFANLFLGLLVPWNMAFDLESQALAVPRRFLLVAPAVEEGLKALAILAVMLMLRPQFTDCWEAMVYGGVIAAGFAAMQNVFYLFLAGYEVAGFAGVWNVFASRVVLGGFMTTLCGSGIGAILAWAQTRPKVWQRWHTAFTLWTGIYGLRVIRNGIVLLLAQGSQLSTLNIAGWVDGLGWLVAVIVAIFILRKEYRSLSRYLAQQVQEGSLQPEQAAMLRRRFLPARLRIFPSFRSDPASRAVFLCSELAIQQAAVGTNPDAAKAYQKLQQELVKLVSQLSQAS